MNGKGDKRRKTNESVYRDEYDCIFKCNEEVEDEQRVFLHRRKKLDET